jgi:Ca2+-binding RTX toxin-like protein
MPTVSDYTALLSGTYWNGIDWTSTPWPSGRPLFVTYAFPTVSPAAHGTVTGLDRSSFQAFSAADQAVAREALEAWGQACGLTFLEVAPGRGQIEFAWYDFSSLSWAQYSGGFAFYPFGDWDYASQPNYFGDDGASGDVFVNLDYREGGVADYGLLLHEIGHAIGLKHPDEVLGNGHDEVLDESLNNTANTIMSYNVVPGDPALGPLDVAAAQFIYGTDAADGTQVASWSWNAATETLTQTGYATADTILGVSVRDVITGLGGNDRIFALAGNDQVDGGGGNDSLWGGTGNDSLIGGGGNDELRGGLGNDTLNGSAGNDRLYGEDGADRLNGGAGNDWLDGGAGLDRIVYTATALNSGDVTAGGRDTIAGAVGDRLDFVPGLEALLKVGGTALSALAANTALGGTFTAGVTNIRFLNASDQIQIDLDGNGLFSATLDFQISVAGVSSVTYIAAGDYFALA